MRAVHDGQRFGPKHIGQADVAIKMWEQHAFAGRFPFERIKPVGFDRAKDQPVDACKVLGSGGVNCFGGGKVDIAVGDVDGCTHAFAFGLQLGPFISAENFVNQHSPHMTLAENMVKRLAVTCLSYGKPNRTFDSGAVWFQAGRDDQPMGESMLSKILTSTCALAMTAGMAAADYSLTILHTNDFHARFEPISKYDSGCSSEDNAEGKCFGGTARLITAVNDARARTNNSILVDGGDQFQGTLFYTQYKGAMAAEFMNKLGYDGMTVGNHEFDDGPEVLREFMDTVEFPVLMSNADVSGEPLLADTLMKSTVIERGGEKIGLIGLTPQDTDELASPGDNVVFTEPAQAVQGEVDKLEAMGVNKIIVLSHSSYAVDLAVAEATTGVDVIVGGHSNTLLSNTSDRAQGPYPTMVGDTAVVQAYAYGKYLGELNVTFDDNGVITEASGEPILIDASVAEDDATVARIAELAAPLDEIRNRVVAETAEEIVGVREECRAVECAMGNLIADAMLARVADQGVQVAIQNGGGIRASIDAGPVTMGEVLTVLPFQNTLSTFEVTGAVLKEALENGVSQIEEGAGRFPQVAGMTFTVDPSAEAGSRIMDVMIGGAALDMDATYGVVSNNYVRNGGDGYAMFKGAANAYDFGPDLADVTAEFLAANGPYTPYKDGRITVK